MQRQFAFIFIFIMFLYANFAFAATYESIAILNSTNLAKYFNTYLGDYYNSHGCLHFTPSDIYLLTKTIPKGIPLNIKGYDDDIPPFDIMRLNYLNEFVTSSQEIDSVAQYFKTNETKLLVYPQLGRLFIIVNEKPFAQVRTRSGPINNFRMVINLEKGKPIEWDQIKSTPTDWGEYNIFGSTSHYISPTYYQTTVVPFGSLLKKTNFGWVFQDNDKWYQLPKNIVTDISLPYGQGEYNYYDVSFDKDGKISSVRWGSNDFGKYVLLWTENGKNYYPEMGYCEGQLLFEQIMLVKDLAYILTVPGSDELENCIAENKNFQIYKDANLFIESKGNYTSKNLDSTACSYYKLYNGLKLTKEDYQNLDPRVLEAFNKYKNGQLPWLAWEKDEREKIIGLYYFVRDYNLAFKKQANWYKKIKDDWSFWRNLRQKLREDFKEMSIYSSENQQNIAENWLNNRLEFELVSPTFQVQNFKNESFFSFFIQEDESSTFTEREKVAMRDILRQSAKGGQEGLKLFSVDALNNYNFGVLLNEMLGNLYKSHGCLHVTPRNSYLLYTLLPIGAKISVYNYSKKYDENEFKNIPYLEELVNFEKDLNKLKENFSNPSSVEVSVYPSSGVWIIYLGGKAFAKLWVESGPSEKRYILDGRDDKENPIFEKNLAYPTSPGVFYVFKTVEDYVSNTYYDLSVIPMGAVIKKDKNKWIFNNKDKWFSVPEVIQQDLDSPAQERDYTYYDITKDQSGSFIQAKWGNHPFGKYSILISTDKKYPSPEIIHSSGDLIMEQRQLVKDLIKIISAPFDKLEDCIKFSPNFDFYSKCNKFVEGPERYDILGTIESASYKIYYDLPLTTEEANSISPDVFIANKIIKKKGKLTNREINILVKEGLAFKKGKNIKIDMGKIMGIQYDTYGYVVAIKKYAHHYSVLKEHWNELTDLRNALFKDFKNFIIQDPIIFYNFARELILKRIDFEKLTQKDAFELLNRLLELSN